MVHSKLRRSLRLFADLLPLDIVGASINRCHMGFLTRIRYVCGFLFFNKQGSPVCHLPGRQLSKSFRTHVSEWATTLRRRRCAASGGLVLAVSLEVCGCDLTGRSSPAFSGRSKDLHRSPCEEQGLSSYIPAVPLNGPSLQPFQDDVSGRNHSDRWAAAEAKSLPWAIPESVYFVYRGGNPAGGDVELHPRQPVATAFVLSVPDLHRRRYTRFLVTARHVVDPEWAHCTERNPASIDLRLNRRSGGIGYEKVSLRSGASRRFYTPLDSTADIAVMQLDKSLIPHIDEYKFIDIPFDVLLTGSEMGLLRANQQVTTVRSSSTLTSDLNTYPVLDAGILSNRPTEAVSVPCGTAPNLESQSRSLHVWFINAGVLHGVSGAPVYASLARNPGVAESRVLLGIQSVAWPDRGIAGMTPSPTLVDLIRSALRQTRLRLRFHRATNR